VQLAGFLPVVVDTVVHLVHPDVGTPRDFLVDLFVGLVLILFYPVSLVPVAFGFFPQARRILSTIETDASFAPPLARQAIVLLLLAPTWCHRSSLFHRTPEAFQSWYLDSGLPRWEGAVFAIVHSLLVATIPQRVSPALTRQAQAKRPFTLLH
jgi:hypothetical protein